MAKGLVKFSKLALKRIFRPFKPLAKLLKRPLVLTLLLTGVLAVAIAGRFYFSGGEFDQQEKAQWRPWQTQAKYTRVRAEIAAWEKIKQERPYSKDVLLRLAFLYAQINEAETARDYFNQAQYLDPAISPLPFSR